ncbi:hypothetical protein AB0A77_05760 [Streptomyces varsoviensis]|uniref:hypothetical protein n=1 Tax=Streptomyces varsoviensis TaxID=67373 RepID=UPI0033F80067
MLYDGHGQHVVIDACGRTKRWCATYVFAHPDGVETSNGIIGEDWFDRMRAGLAAAACGVLDPDDQRVRDLRHTLLRISATVMRHGTWEYPDPSKWARIKITYSRVL